MFIKTLTVEGFRNLKSQCISFSPNVNLFIGNNAQGKTNILEAISFLSTTKSFRCHKSKDAIFWGGKSFSLSANIVDELGEFEVDLSISKTSKDVSLDGNKVNSALNFVGKVLTIVFSALDLAIVRGFPEYRRSLMDRYIVDIYPNYIKSVLNYNKSVKAKLHLIRSGEVRYQLIEPWNEIISRESVKIWNYRADFIENLNQQLLKNYHIFSLSSSESLSLEYVSDISKFETVSNVLDALEKNFQTEIKLSRILIGIHRDDIRIVLSGKSAKDYASQGQVRSIALALKLSILEMIEKNRSTAPIVLLDDVDAELDQYRADSFFNFMLSEQRQVIVTSTNSYSGLLLREQNVNSFEVKDGVVFTNNHT